jgi:hypothetical protein
MTLPRPASMASCSAKRSSQPTVYAHELPVVLSADEMVKFLETISSQNSRILPTTAYAAGLCIEDVDSVRRVIQVRHGKASDSFARRRSADGLISR